MDDRRAEMACLLARAVDAALARLGGATGGGAAAQSWARSTRAAPGRPSCQGWEGMQLFWGPWKLVLFGGSSYLGVWPA
jgi:hypothetical protein